MNLLHDNAFALIFDGETQYFYYAGQTAQAVRNWTVEAHWKKGETRAECWKRLYRMGWRIVRVAICWPI